MATKTLTCIVTDYKGERLEVRITLDVEAVKREMCAKAAASVGGRATLRDGLIRASAEELHIDFDGIAREWGQPSKKKRGIAGGRITVSAKRLHPDYEVKGKPLSRIQKAILNHIASARSAKR